MGGPKSTGSNKFEAELTYVVGLDKTLEVR